VSVADGLSACLDLDRSAARPSSSGHVHDAADSVYVAHKAKPDHSDYADAELTQTVVTFAVICADFEGCPWEGLPRP